MTKFADYERNLFNRIQHMNKRFMIHSSFTLNDPPGIKREERAPREFALNADCSTILVALLINTPRCLRKPRPLRRKWHQREATRGKRGRERRGESDKPGIGEPRVVIVPGVHTRKVYGGIRRFAKHIVTACY